MVRPASSVGSLGTFRGSVPTALVSRRASKPEKTGRSQRAAELQFAREVPLSFVCLRDLSCVICDKRPEQADVMCLCDSEESGLAGESDSVRGEGVCCISERDDLVAESEGDDTVNNDSSDVATGSEGLEGDKFDTEIGQSLEGEWQGQQVVAPWPTENISGRLRKCLGVWRDIGASRWVQDVLYFGYKLPFLQLPKHAVFENHTACNKHRSYVDKAIAELVVCGAAEKWRMRQPM